MSNKYFFLYCMILLLVIAGCKDSIPGEDSMTSIDKSNKQPLKEIQDNCTDKCHKRGSFMDPILINGEGIDGKHKKHVGDRGFFCTTCHYNYASMESHRNNVLDTNDSTIQIVYFNPINWNLDDDRRGTWTGDQGVVDGVATGGCASLYCHGKKPNSEDENDYPKWYEDITFECTYCHNPGAPIDPTSNFEAFPEGSHSSSIVQNYNGEGCTTSGCHDGESGLGYYKTSELVPANAHPRHVTDVGLACEMCHFEYKERGTHANGTLNSAEEVIEKINFNPTLNPKGVYDPVTKTCSNLYCHGDVWGDESNSRSSISKGIDTTPVWTDLSTGDCGNCHKADPNHSQGSHTRHLNPPYSFPCYKCHFDNRGGTREDGSLITRQDHHVKEALPVNGVVNIIFDNKSLPANPSGIFDSSEKSCSSLYCHGSQMLDGSNGTSTTPTWGDRIEPWCGTCHDVDIFDSSEETIRSTGRHELHLSDESGDILNGPRIKNCTRCHPGSFVEDASEDSRNYIQELTHVNGVINFIDSTFDGMENFWGEQPVSQWAMMDATFDAGKTCTSSGCHVTQPETQNFMHSDLKKKHSYNTTADPYAPVDGSGTAVCNPCHSPGGDYDGVNNLFIGSKFNWLEGVYTSDADSTADEDFTISKQTRLKSGKEKWCAGCHDNSPSIIDIEVEGGDATIDAPQVVGDETITTNYGTGWGFYKTGHGVPEAETMPWTGTLANRDSSGNWSTDGRPGANRNCPDCHNPTLPHIDGEHRTFDCSVGCDPDEYQQGYRLRLVNNELPLIAPKVSTADFVASDARLCFQCHNSTRFIDSSDGQTNFRTSVSPLVSNKHFGHLSQVNHVVDVDWDQSFESQFTCVICHNVHGSTQYAMIRDGALTRGPRLIVFYGQTGIAEINPSTDPCDENNLLDPANADKGVLLLDSDARLFCGNTLYPTGSDMCTYACHQGDERLTAPRPGPYELNSPMN